MMMAALLGAPSKRGRDTGRCGGRWDEEGLGCMRLPPPPTGGRPERRGTNGEERGGEGERGGESESGALLCVLSSSAASLLYVMSCVFVGRGSTGPMYILCRRLEPPLCKAHARGCLPPGEMAKK